MEEKVLLKIVADDYGVSTHLNVDSDLEMTAVVMNIYGMALKGPDEFRKKMAEYSRKMLTKGGPEELADMCHVIPTDFNNLLHNDNR